MNKVTATSVKSALTRLQNGNFANVAVIFSLPHKKKDNRGGKTKLSTL
jgi:hypothetical protein